MSELVHNEQITIIEWDGTGNAAEKAMEVAQGWLEIEKEKAANPVRRVKTRAEAMRRAAEKVRAAQSEGLPPG